MKNGGPAFPVPHEVMWNGTKEPLIGVSLRDYVAIAVLPTLIANDETSWQEDVNDALAIANLYIEQRDKHE